MAPKGNSKAERDRTLMPPPPKPRQDKSKKELADTCECDEDISDRGPGKFFKTINYRTQKPQPFHWYETKDLTLVYLRVHKEWTLDQIIKWKEHQFGQHTPAALQGRLSRLQGARTNMNEEDQAALDQKVSEWESWIGSV